MPAPKIQILFFDSYLAFIKNSVGSTMFRTVYAVVDGKKQDLLHGGELSCAYYVSSVLKMFSLIDSVHATVSGTIRDIEGSGWKKVKSRTPRRGSVVVWKKVVYEDGEAHRHMGFVIEKNEAVSSSYRKRKIALHHVTYNKSRKIEAVYWHQKLEKKFAGLKKSRYTR